MNDINTEQSIDQKLQEFGEDIVSGLNSNPKKLSSKYFYDETGDKIFQQIMALDEYYLTRAEFEILDNYKDEILKIVAGKDGFNFFELGAGDGYKTKLLLRHFIDREVDFTYFPIDISGNVLEELQQALKSELPALHVHPLEGDYFKMLRNISDESGKNKLILFLGSNIGNFAKSDAVRFLSLLRDSLSDGDFALIGVDLKKDPKVILKAYNDSKGVTRAFNMNLLDRINDTFDGNFDKEQFVHSPVYDPSTGECRSYMLSKQEQTVTLPALGETIHFRKWEPIHMEISKKYDVYELEELASEAGFEVVRHFQDANGYFVDSLWRAK
ncbi:MAG: L-histidine N(alpha)-methyltransferase [Cyclobacteriaceae bacterium]